MWIGHRKVIRSFVGANRGVVGCVWFIYRKMELRYWLVPGNVKTATWISWMKSVRCPIPWGLRVPIWEINFCSRVLRLFMLLWCGEMPQIAICCLEWLRRLKRLPTALDAFLSSSSTSRRRSIVDDIGWGTGEMISDLDGSLGSRYFLNVANERTCFASCACTFKSSGLITCLECTSN